MADRTTPRISDDDIKTWLSILPVMSATNAYKRLEMALLDLRDTRAELARLRQAILDASQHLYEADDMLLGASVVSTGRRNDVHELIAAARAVLVEDGTDG